LQNGASPYTHVRMLKLFLFLGILSSTAALAYTTEKLPIACGYSEYMYGEYIAAQVGEKSVFQASFASEQGENHRRIFIYKDGSWFFTFEFLSSGAVSKDITCIVLRGEGEQSETIYHYPLKELPAQDVGPALDRQLLTKRFRPASLPPTQFKGRH
jgi:hypothetical protein